ncbi:hypothetical protein TSOC_011432 [Tetrabaena socialis]|uniref:Uncharacterized protein n=1 Tax=Tetrabaena socialis TaxID=47790 RepID=A0A2J7ZQP6_9CHLO|nr:hypothetical protein TSOC_011432 [Tetrabaena socialis]|eukprot:PNH02576.1 hypothetical protein TSOC_011432 [Tetrabaena socialis]
MSLQAAVPRVFASFLGRAPVALGSSGVLGSSNSFKGQGFNGSLQSVEDHVYGQAFSTSSQDEQNAPSQKAATGLRLPGMGGNMLLSKSRAGVRSGAMVPFAAQQAMNMSSARAPQHP